MTWKIFYTSIFPLNDFRTQTPKREREREREREIGLAPSSSDHRPKPRRTVELTPLRSRWGDRPAEIAPWDCTPLDRTVRSSRRPLDWTLFVSISAPPEACRSNGFVYWEWFCFDFCFFKSLYIEIFYYKICLKAEKMW